MSWYLQRKGSSEYYPYKPSSIQTFTKLCTGLKYVNSYVQKIRMGLTMPQNYNEYYYIKQKLMPSADNAKHNFDAMLRSAEEQLHKINIALERTVSHQKTLNYDMRNIKAEEAKISVESKRKKTAVEHAKANLNCKEEQLSDLREMLRTAEVKLQEAQESQETAVKVGIGLSLIPFVGLLAGPIAYYCSRDGFRK